MPRTPRPHRPELADSGKPAPRDLPPLRTSLLRNGLRLAVILGIALGIHLLIEPAKQWTEAMPPETGAIVRAATLIAVLAVYALLIALPFVPGVEIGMALILMRGAEVAVFVYLATIAGLMLAYLSGRYMPFSWLRRIFLDLRLARAGRLLEEVQPLTPERRLALLRSRMPGRLGHYAVRFRYVLLAGLVNLPGSVLIGGGGGICLVAGLTRVFTPRTTLLTLALAVLPVPLAVWLYGPGILSH